MPSNESDEIEYYRTRAAEERAAAADASKAEVAAIHQELARLYEALARQPDLRPRAPRRGRAKRLRTATSRPLPYLNPDSL